MRGKHTATVILGFLLCFGAALHASAASHADMFGADIRAHVESRKKDTFDRVCDRLRMLQERHSHIRLPWFCDEVPVVIPTVSLSGIPLSVFSGATTTLSWSSTHATTCTASNGWSGAKALSGSEVVTVNATTTYTLMCENADGSDTESVTIGIIPFVPSPQPELSFSAAPLNVFSGATSTLAWDSTDATMCSASNGWTGFKSLDGTEIVTVYATTTYTLDCGNGTATSTESITINVMPLPILTFDANPDVIMEGATSTLSWNSEHATSCTASNGWSGAKPLAGIEIVSPSATTTYTLSCTGPGGMVLKSVEVGFVPEIDPEPVIGHVVISEVYYDVGAGKGSETANEWIELYNGSLIEVNITGWSLEDINGTSTDDFILGTTTIPAGGFLVITNATTTLDFWSIASPVVALESPIGNGLGDAGDSLWLKDSSASIVDYVSWGAATGTTPMIPTVSDVAAGHSIFRMQLSSDTDTNAEWDDLESPTPGAF